MSNVHAIRAFMEFIWYALPLAHLCVMIFILISYSDIINCVLWRLWTGSFGTTVERALEKY